MRRGRVLLCAAVFLTGCGGSAPLAKQRNAASATAPPATTIPATTVPPTTVPPTTVPPTTLPAVSPATDAAGLAAELTDVETTLHDPATPPALFARDALRQQLAFGELATHPSLMPEVLAHVPTQWQAAVKANTDAAADLDTLSSPVAELPDWRITAPTSSPAMLVTYYKQGQAATGVPWQVLAAIHLVESKMSRLRSNSSAGAQGPMQFIPATWAAYGEGGNVDDDHDAILGAANFLHASGAPGDLPDAIFHYNLSHDYVNAVLDYANQMETDPSAFMVYYDWQVLYLLNSGTVVLPVGYPKVRPIPVS